MKRHILRRKVAQQHAAHAHRLGQQTELWICLLLKVSTSQIQTVISVLEWEEPVHRGATVPRAPVCRCPAPGGRTQTGWENTNTHLKLFSLSISDWKSHWCCASLHLTDVFGCSPCPPGHYCGNVALIHPSGLCQAGFYCPGGDSAATGGSKLLSKFLFRSRQ